MRFKAIIFDLDGTLLDTLQDLANSYNRVLAENKFPTHPIDTYRRFIGNGARICVERALSPENRDSVTINKILRAFRKDYSQNWNIHTKPYKGIPEMIAGLSKLGFKMAILSNEELIQSGAKRTIKSPLSILSLFC